VNRDFFKMVSFEAGGLRILHLFSGYFSGYTSNAAKHAALGYADRRANAAGLEQLQRRSTLQCPQCCKAAKQHGLAIRERREER
jgi:hypothetical protein